MRRVVDTLIILCLYHIAAENDCPEVDIDEYEYKRNISYLCLNSDFKIISPDCNCTIKLNACKKNEIFFKGSCIIQTENISYENFICPFGTTPYNFELKSASATYWHYNNFIKSNFLNDDSEVYKKLPSICYDVIEDSVGVAVHEMDCNESYEHYCKYNAAHIYKCPENCISSTIQTNSCLCLKQLNTFVNRNEICSSFGKLTAGDLQILKEWYNEKDYCWIGIENTTINSDGNFFAAINKKEITYKEDRTLKCGICQEPPLPFTNVNLTLKFSYGHLLLTVQSISSVYSINDEQVFCFTNAGKELHQQVEVKVKKSHQKYNDERRYELTLEKYPGQYWCYAFQLPTLEKIKSNTVLAYKKSKGNEYSLRIADIEEPCSNTYEELENTLENLVEKLNFSKILNTKIAFTKPMIVYKMEKFENNCVYDILFHITTKKKKNVTEEYSTLRKNLIVNKGLNVIYFRSCFFCIQEDSNMANWTFRTTDIGSASISLQYCILNNGLPLTRNCSGNFLEGGYWLTEVNTSCSGKHVSTPLSKELHTIIQSSNYTYNASIIKQVASIISKQEENHFKAVDIFYLSYILKDQILENIDIPVKVLLAFFEKLTKANREELKRAQIFYQSSDDLLRILDYFLNEHDEGHCFYMKGNGLIVQKTYPFRDGIGGISVYNQNGSINVFNLTDGLNISDAHDLLLASYIDNETLDELALDMTQEERNNVSLNIIVFLADVFFIDPTQAGNSNSVISISLPQFGTYLPKPIQLIMQNENITNTSCVYWEYDGNLEIHENRQSYWSDNGGQLIQTEDNICICEFNHLTHFALLIRGQTFAEEGNYTEFQVESQTIDRTLETITIVGCCLSFIGTCGIFITALILKKWRQKLGPKLLLNLSAALLAEIILMQIAGVDDWHIKKTSCTIIGVLLQYSVLAKFFWMLIIAYLQYLRFIVILKPVPDHFLLKSVLTGWCIPLIPTIITVAVAHDSYGGKNQKFCYPKAMSLYLGIILPIIIIAIINTIVFWKIIYNIKLQSHGHKEFKKSISKDNIKRQCFLAILLFFLLGIPWVFGILSEFFETSIIGVILSYLFCVFATLQGFVLFIFYVILDPDTNTMWRDWIVKLKLK